MSMFLYLYISRAEVQTKHINQAYLGFLLMSLILTNSILQMAGVRVMIQVKLAGQE